MVRLKGSSFYGQSKYINISIPYGAIKSQQMNLDTYFSKIFQFLMVRLKEERDYLFEICGLISIPYGAIKR